MSKIDSEIQRVALAALQRILRIAESDSTARSVSVEVCAREALDEIRALHRKSAKQIGASLKSRKQRVEAMNLAKRLEARRA